MIKNIINKIKEINNSIVIVAIDGGGGSGKSTLAIQIASDLHDVQIVQMDDFYKLNDERKIPKLVNAPSGYEFDIQRLISQVIIPVLSNKTAEYQKYNWNDNRLEGCYKVKSNGILIIEGCYSMIKELINYYHLKIFVDCDRDIRLNRGLERDGISSPFWIDCWKNWMEGEDKYFSEQRPKENADFIYVSDNAV